MSAQIPETQQNTNEAQEPSTSSPYGFKALAVVGVTSGYIIGPLALIGGLGWWLSQRYNSPFILLGSLFIALIVTNVLIFTRTSALVKQLSKK